MGVNLKDLAIKHNLELKDLAGKKIAIDAYNVIYQFLSTIRQYDGTPLMDKNGNVTSHLSGLFYRTVNLMEAGIFPTFVFDGKAPIEKQAVQEARREIRETAREKYKEALERGDKEEARKYAQQTSRLTPAMIQESKELIRAMGLPWVQALSEGEAQAAYMCNKGDVWAVASQDYDTLLFAAPRLIRNLSISRKKDVNIEIIDLIETLNHLHLDISGLVDIGLLVGTDYNVGGVSGIGPKNALKIVQEHKFNQYKNKIISYTTLKNLFLQPIVNKDYELVWNSPDARKIKEILVDRHGFTEDRIDAAIKRMTCRDVKQKGLGDFI
ncbi:MAG: flap endonuclease-1 [Nanoarchaeota archaeon]